MAGQRMALVPCTATARCEFVYFPKRALPNRPPPFEFRVKVITDCQSLPSPLQRSGPWNFGPVVPLEAFPPSFCSAPCESCPYRNPPFLAPRSFPFGGPLPSTVSGALKALPDAQADP